MNSLLELRTYLHAQLYQDRLYQLALTCTWLDPLWLGERDPEALNPDYYEADDFHDPLYLALLICRDCFPEIYVEAVMGLHAEMSENKLGELICEGIQKHGIPLEYIENIWWGIPLHVYGTCLEKAEFYQDFPQVEILLESLGIHWEDDLVGDCVTIICFLVDDLIETPRNSIAENIAWTLAWIWGVSGNSALDYNSEEIEEIEPLAWGEDNIELAAEMMAQAQELFAKAQAGLDYLCKNANARAQLARNFQKTSRIYQKMTQEGERLSDEQRERIAKRLHLDWAFTRTSSERASTTQP